MYIQLIVVGLIIWIIVRALRRKPESDQISERLKRLEERLALIEQRLEGTATAVITVKPTPIPVNSPVFPSEVPSANPDPVSPVPAVIKTPAPSPSVSAAPSPATQRWRHIERMFVENWTGILGSVAVVAGVTFIGIYSALQLSSFHRFLMMVAVAGAMVVASFMLRRRESWLALSQWVRSAAAAIFLFACAASGGLPGLGLQWIDAPMSALGLLLLGMVVNLYLAWIGGTQTFASLHVVLSMLPLAIVPQSAMSLGIASGVALYGVALSYKARWDQHLLVVLGSYAFYHLSWYFRLTDVLHAPSFRVIGALSAIVVCTAAALVHYRKDYASQKMEPWPLLVHLSNWTLLGLALFIYRNEYVPRSLALALGGIIAYVLARRARPLGVRWLYLSDTLIGQAMVVAALASLYPIIANLQLILLTLFLESMLFFLLVFDEGEKFLARVGWYMASIMGVLFAVAGIHGFGAKADLYQDVLILLVGAAASIAILSYLARHHAERFNAIAWQGREQEAMGWVTGLIVIAGLLNLMDGDWMEPVALISGGGMLLASRIQRAPGLLAGATAVVIAAHVMSWVMTLLHMPWDALPLSQHIGPLIALAVLMIWVAKSDIQRQVAIYLFGLDAALAVYLIFEPVSPLIPGVAWLMLSLVALEIADRLERASAAAAVLMGYAYLIAFAGAYALVIIQSPAYLGVIRSRLLIELLGIGVLLYWWAYHPRPTVSAQVIWNRIHPFFLEFVLIAIAVTNVVEVPGQWRPLTWSIFSLALLGANTAWRIDGRLRMYSLVFYWVSVANVAVIMSVYESPSQNWYDRPDIMSLFAIALQTVYIATSHERLALADIPFPRGLGALDALGKRIAVRRNLWVYYPFFAALALFLFWRFDRSVLTLLWAAEAFVVFVLSAVLRENQFRYIALAGLGACLVRLMLIDMVETDLGLRGLVFVGVGSLMLGMNAIYNRYRARYQ